jgi:hypothetical protein
MTSDQAKELVNQLTQSHNGMNRLVAMTGAKNVIYSENENYVSFRIPNSPFNYVKIVLNSLDLYDVYFEKHIFTKCKMTKQVIFKDVYNDSLKELFEKQTGLLLSL